MKSITLMYHALAVLAMLLLYRFSFKELQMEPPKSKLTSLRGKTFLLLTKKLISIIEIFPLFPIIGNSLRSSNDLIGNTSELLYLGISSNTIPPKMTI